jgi:hypothetical protein
MSIIEHKGDLGFSDDGIKAISNVFIMHLVI